MEKLVVVKQNSRIPDEPLSTSAQQRTSRKKKSYAKHRPPVRHPRHHQASRRNLRLPPSPNQNLLLLVKSNVNFVVVKTDALGHTNRPLKHKRGYSLVSLFTFTFFFDTLQRHLAANDNIHQKSCLQSPAKLLDCGVSTAVSFIARALQRPCRRVRAFAAGIFWG